MPGTDSFISSLTSLICYLIDLLPGIPKNYKDNVISISEG